MTYKLKLTKMTLGELIDALDKIPREWDVNDEPKTVRFDFGSAIPAHLDSWRGDYAQLALGYKLTGYDSSEEHSAKVTLSDFLDRLKSGVGATYDGWKGGTFVMGRGTDVWVDNPGNYNHTQIASVEDRGWYVVLHTKSIE